MLLEAPRPLETQPEETPFTCSGASASAGSAPYLPSVLSSHALPYALGPLEKLNLWRHSNGGNAVHLQQRGRVGRLGTVLVAELAARGRVVCADPQQRGSPWMPPYQLFQLTCCVKRRQVDLRICMSL